MGENSDEEDEYTAHGADVPMSPCDDVWSQASMSSPRNSPMSMDAVSVFDGDIMPVINLLEGSPFHQREVLEHNVEILKLVDQLGSGSRSYRRHRQTALKNLVAEIYSAPRVTKALKLLPGLGLTAGFALDLTTTDDDGNSWDFTKEEMKEKARNKVRNEEPMLLVGSPSCTEFSTWQALNAAKHNRDEAKIATARLGAEAHMLFVAELYQMQLDAKRYFLHEHPSGATSWQLVCIRKLLSHEQVERVNGDQCQYDQADASGSPIRKATGWMSNSDEILRMLDAKCPGRSSSGGGVCSNGKWHGIASGRAAREAAVYPFKLCKAILVGFRNQMVRDGRLPRGSHGFQMLFEEDAVTSYVDAITGEALDSDDAEAAARVFSMSTKSSHRPSQAGYVDSVTGQPLEGALVEQARAIELKYFDDQRVWQKRPYAEAMAKQGKKPISVKWIDTNKGDEDNPNYRSRLVAREIRKRGENPIFAPTPPLESLRTILSLAATDMHGQPKHVREPSSELRTQVSFIDISRAYFCASTDPSEPTYVELPLEDPDHGAFAGLLLKHMYGTRKAADGWHCEYAGKLRDLGFEVGEASACVFFHRSHRLRCSVHGDDFTTVGTKSDLDWFKAELGKHY